MMETTGDLCETRRTFEWKIKDFLLFKCESGEGVKSPQFSVYGASWVIRIYPYGQKRDESDEWISLYLTPISLPKPLKINVSFSIKTAEQKSDLIREYTYLFEKLLGVPSFILRSRLIDKKSELLPTASLTVICTLKNEEPNAFSEFLNASAQTEEGTGIWQLQQHLREISLSGDASDIMLKVEDQEFKSHRCILSARSPVFSAMMKNKMMENVTGVVDIQDVDPKTFSDFLNYLYTGSKQYITVENATKLYTAADKYQVEVLKENCLDHMLVNVSIENFCDMFIISLQHNEEKLKETCIQFFGEHLLDIVKTCKWQSFLCENTIIGNELLIKHIELNKDIYTLLSKKSQK